MLYAFEGAQPKRKRTLNGSPFDDRAPRPAIFLDRDGTVLESVHYLSDPGDVRLLPGVTTALSTLHDHGFALIVITNQSAIERGIIDEARLAEIHEEMRWQLAEDGVDLDGIYWCPVAPKTSDRTVVEHEDRKPGPGMLKRAARELHLTLPESWMIGDAICDVLAGMNAGCKGSIRVETGHPLSDKELALELAYETVQDLTAAAVFILNV